jgi:hypothetical protein
MENAAGVTSSIATEAGPIEVTRIGHSSSQRPESPRWTEVTVFRAGNGGFIVREVGRSLVPGEVDRVRTYSGHDARVIVAELVRGKRGLSIVAEEAVNEAADSDQSFAASLRDSLDVEDVGSGAPAPGSLLVSLPRDYDRALRIRAKPIAYLTSRSGTKEAWSEITIFALDDGGFAVGISGRNVTGKDERFGARAGDAAAVLDALMRYGGLTEVAFEALEAAAKASPAFAADLAGRHRDVPALHALRRTQARRLRFAGVRIGSEKAGTPQGEVATELFRTTTGAYVVGQAFHPVAGEAEYNAMSFDTTSSFVSAVRSMSRIRDAAALLREAARNDPRIASAVAEVDAGA